METKNMKIEDSDTLSDLQYSEEYAEYLMDNPREETSHICNGDTLVIAMERGILFDEFLKSAGYEVTI